MAGAVVFLRRGAWGMMQSSLDLEPAQILGASSPMLPFLETPLLQFSPWCMAHP